MINAEKARLKLKLLRLKIPERGRDIHRGQNSSCHSRPYSYCIPSQQDFQTFQQAAIFKGKSPWQAFEPTMDGAVWQPRKDSQVSKSQTQGHPE